MKAHHIYPSRMQTPLYNVYQRQRLTSQPFFFLVQHLGEATRVAAALPASPCLPKDDKEKKDA